MRFGIERVASLAHVGQVVSVFRRDGMWWDRPLHQRVEEEAAARARKEWLREEKKRARKRKKSKETNSGVHESGHRLRQDRFDELMRSDGSPLFLQDMECPRYCRGENWEWLLC